MPRLFTTKVGTAQVSGPIPDTNITPNTLASTEVDCVAAPTATTNRIAFASNGVDLDHNYRIDPVPPPTPGFIPRYHVWIMRPDGSEQIQITTGTGDEREPTYDPGARWIAFSSNATGTYQIYAINLNTQAIYQITSGAGNKRHPTYSTDGNWLAYASDQSGTFHIYKIAGTGAGTPVQLTSGVGNQTEPTWAPGSNAILYTGDAGAHTRIFQTDDQGNPPEQLSNGGNDPNADDQDPSWLPVGTGIAFASSRKTSGLDAFNNFNIWQMTTTGEIAGSDAVLITDTDETSDANNIHPFWVPSNLRAPVRLVWSSNRADGTRATFDIWTRMQSDDRPVLLLDKPYIDGPRQVTPGNDVTIHVALFDEDSGVRSATALLKDPDQKLYYRNLFGGHDPEFDDGYLTGIRYLEWDFDTVGTAPLYDDGDPANGDAVAGDGIFSGVFTTSASPRDYVIDIVAQDNSPSGNPFTYDNVFGFTGKTFAPSTNILFVDDYCEGQKFLYRSGNNNDFPTAWPVESYWRYNPSTYQGIYNIDYDSIQDYYGEPYDVWRILCRGPIPPQVYQYYLPTVEYQLDPTESQSDPVSAQPTRRVLVADRSIVWACPKAGDVFIGQNSGDLLDAATQADLGLFLDRGGRLMMGGENIAWALTLRGTVTNDFLTRYLHANFVADNPVLQLQYWQYWGDAIGGFIRILDSGYSFTLASVQGDPVSDDPWRRSRPIEGIHGGNWDEDDRPYRNVNSPRYYVLNAPDYTDNSEFSMRPDIIAPINPTEKLYGYGTFSGPAAAVCYEDSTSGARVVYLAFGFEQLNRRYHTTNENGPHCRNFRSHLMHNANCWMRTGGFEGRVISISDGGKPISKPPYPIVYCLRAGAQVSHAVRCQADGTYVISGLPPDFYTLEAVRPGYAVDHYEGEFVHGGLAFRDVDFAIKIADPGAITGVVTSAATGTAINNVLISVQAIPVVVTNPDGSTTTTWPGNTTAADWPKTFHTAADGTYTASNLPAGDYDVTADGTAVGYGTAGPQTATVTSNNVTHLDFQLPAADGTVVATVTDGNTSLAIVGATVDVLVGTRIMASGTTDSTGTARVNIQPGDYQAMADAPGYGQSPAQSVTVVSLQSTDPPLHFVMTPQPPGSVTGRIISAVSGLPVGGVQVWLTAPGQPDQSVTTTADLRRDTPAGALYNFKFASAPAGTVTIRPQPVGFTANPPQASVVVTSGAVTSNIVFSLSSLHTFAPGLQLISLPGDYSAMDPSAVFRLPTGTNLHLAAWEAPRQQYVTYAMAPADRIRPGVGYWLYLTASADLTQTGGNVPNQVSVPLFATWNLVGDPYVGSIDIFTAQVRDSATGIVYDWQTARQRGLILSSLWAYVIGAYQPSGSLSPYIGHWVACSRPLTVLINNTGTAAAPRARPAAAGKPASGWGFALTVKAGDAVDANTFLGVAPGASDGFDAGLDELKPPTPPNGPYVAACAVAEGAPADRSHLAVDMRAKAGETYKITVETDQTGEPITVTWPDLSGLPSDVRPILRDPVAGKRVYMRTSSAYTYTAREAARALEITLEAGGNAALVVSALQARAVGGQAEIVYTLSRAATVDIQVINMSGLRVRSLSSGGVAAAGQNRAVWDGRNERGAKVPAGRYLVVVRALGDSGEQTRAVAALQLGR
jgi:hypothetical protein